MALAGIDYFLGKNRRGECSVTTVVGDKPQTQGVRNGRQFLFNCQGRRAESVFTARPEFAGAVYQWAGPTAMKTAGGKPMQCRPTDNSVGL